MGDRMSAEEDTFRGTGGEAVVRALALLGIRHVFGIVSVHNAPIFDALARTSDMHHVPVRHEQAAVHAADAYARTTGRLGVAIVSTGPGTTNAMTGLLEAATASSPVLVITGQVPTAFYGKRKGALHEADRQVDMLRSVARDVVSVGRVEEVLSVVVGAGRAAMRGRRQPSIVEIPIDLQSSAGASALPGKPSEAVVDAPHHDPIRRAIELLASAKRPLIYAGGGVLASNAEDDLLRIAERLEAPVMTSVNGRGSIAEDHRLAVGCIPPRFPQLQGILDGADALLAVGTRFQGPTTGSWSVRLPRPLIHLDVDPFVIGLNYPADVSIVGDAGAGLRMFLEGLPDGRKSEDFALWAAEQRRDVQGAMRLEIGPDHEAVMDTIRAGLPRDANIVRDATLPAYLWGDRLLPILTPRTSIRPTTGAIGPGIAFALGAAVGTGRPTVLLVGDGGAMLSVGELATLSEQGAHVVVCLFNDGGYGILRAMQDHRYGRRSGVDLTTPDFVAMAKAMGLAAEHVASRGAFSGAFERAVARPGPSLIEIDSTALAPMDLSGIARA